MFSYAIPSPSAGEINIGPVTIRAYGVLMVVSICVALWITSKRYRARGGNSAVITEVALWSIPLGIIGARAYHVITSPDQYFGAGGKPLLALQIWRGGLGIWGGVLLGAVGLAWAMHRIGTRIGPFADSIAPALLVAQAIGRWGNWFNQELFGSPTTMPWGLRVDSAHLPPGIPPGTLFHPTFLYECLWNLSMAAVLIILDKRKTFASGQLFCLYLVFYTLGRFWIEMLRIDDAHVFAGIRLNVWTSIAIFILGIVTFAWRWKCAENTRLTDDEQRYLNARYAADSTSSK